MNEIVKVDNIEFKIEVIDNKPMVSSLDIAEKFEKRHDVVIRAIENDDAYSEFLRDHKIVVSEYKVQNKAIKVVDELANEDSFGTVEKFSTVYNNKGQIALANKIIAYFKGENNEK